MLNNAQNKSIHVVCERSMFLNMRFLEKKNNSGDFSQWAVRFVAWKLMEPATSPELFLKIKVW